MKIKLSRCREQAMTMIEAIIVAVVVLLLVSMILPTSRRYPRQRAVRIQCVNNLKQMGIGFRVWANDHFDKYPMEVSTNAEGTKEYDFTPDAFRPFQTMQNELGQSPKVVFCPCDANRSWATNFNYFGNSNLSYFVAVDTSNTNSSPQKLLCGDRNLGDPWGPLRSVTVLKPNMDTRWGEGLHSSPKGDGAGNILLNDGSAQQVSSASLQKNWLTNVTPVTVVIP